jgi:trans-2,3-dihydro-3-hydroxyanthranilate isomerase
MTRYRYFTCDVFTETRFGGNQLAVLPDASGLTDGQMQQIAREFNFAESTFVFPSDSFTRRVRIFTPVNELPFAGHPNVGTAFVLATTGALGPIGETPKTITFEEKAGPVPIAVRKQNGHIWCELTAPQLLTLGKTTSIESVARAISLAPGDILGGTHPPQVASVGTPFLFVQLKDRQALERARANLDGIDAIRAQGIPGYIHLYTLSGDEFDIRCRMFAPASGIPEDPATGSANVALAAMLGHYHEAASGDFSWRIGQGIEMGRPSVLHARVEKRAGVVVKSFIGGPSVMVAEGEMEVEAP